MKNIAIVILALLLQSELYSQNKYFDIKYKWEAIQLFRKVVLLEEEMIFAGNAKGETNNWKAQVCVTTLNGDTISTKEIISPYGHAVFSDFDYSNNLFFFTGNMTQPVGGDSQQTFMFTWDKNNNQGSLYYIGNSEYTSVGRAIILTPDNNIIIVGSSTLQPYAIKVDSLGNVIWEQVYDNYPLLNWLTDIIPVPNEQAYYVIGTVGFNVFNGDILVAKIKDATGEMLWDTIYDFGGVDGALEIKRSQSGGYLICGAAEGFTNTVFKGVTFKVNQDFEIVWYNSQILENCGCGVIHELPGGDVIVAGCNDPQGEYAQMQIIKLSGIDGGMKWLRSYGGSWHDYAYDLALTPDGGFLVAGRQDTIIPGAPVGHASAWVLKLNCMGLLTEPEAAFTHYTLSDAAVQFINQSQYVYPDSIDGGHFIWDFGDGSPPFVCGRGFAPCPSTLTHQYDTIDTYSVTLTAVVCSDTSVVQQTVVAQTVGLPPDPLKGENNLSIYPNPATNTLTFELTGVSKSPLGDLGVNSGWGVGDLEVTLLSLTGQSILQTTLVSTGSTTQTTISVAHLPVGLYIYVVRGGSVVSGDTDNGNNGRNSNNSGGPVLARGKVAIVR